MANPKPEELRARPDFYMLRFRRKVHRQTVKLGREVKKIHASYVPQIKRVAKSRGGSRQYVSIGNMMMDEVFALTHKRVSEVEEYASKEAAHIFDLMMPESVKPVTPPAPRDFWRVEFKGMTGNEREVRLRSKIAKKMRAIPSRVMEESVLREAVIEQEEYATRAWITARSYVESQATNNVWLAGIMSLVDGFDYQNAEQDVISHYEHLATLDELTCEECASLDGAIIDVGLPGMGDYEAQAWSQVSRHNRCRCCPTPVTKTWKELGFDINEAPTGTRIARPYYPKTGPQGGRIWGRSSPGAGTVQGYVPADVRYKDWIKKKGKMNAQS